MWLLAVASIVTVFQRVLAVRNVAGRAGPAAGRRRRRRADGRARARPSGLPTSADRIRWRPADLGYAAGWRLVRALPEWVARNACSTAVRTCAARGGGPDQLRRNLARVLGVPPAEVPDG